MQSLLFADPVLLTEVFITGAATGALLTYAQLRRPGPSTEWQSETAEPLVSRWEVAPLPPAACLAKLNFGSVATDPAARRQNAVKSPEITIESYGNSAYRVIVSRELPYRLYQPPVFG